MEKGYPGKEGHPPSRDNFSERLCEKEVDPELKTAFAHGLIVSP